MTARPVVWSIAGTDSGGGAGLSADARAADACGVHLCPVVAAVTAQNSCAVTRVEPMDPRLIDEQLRTLAADMPPRAVKTGLLGGAAQVQLVAQWIDTLRERGPVDLVVDPVFGASSGAAFADAETRRAYRELLLPRATVITPNRAEAEALLDDGHWQSPPHGLPAIAKALQAQGAGTVCITGGDGADVEGRVLDWLASPQAEGWLALPRVATAHHHGTGCTFATALAAGLARGFVPADAAVLAKMATAHALRHGRPAGLGAGPVWATAGFATDPSLLPQLSFGEAPVFADLAAPTSASTAPRRLGLYALADSAAQVERLLRAGVRTLQLRIKRPPDASAAWEQALEAELARGVALCEQAGAELFVNDHLALAQALGAPGLHLGQEDLLALGEAGRARLAASGLRLGVSTHSLWELCRARSLAPRYIACGPVWPTLTKAMPWWPQGLDNLAWWRHMAGAPVVAIGGVLTGQHLAEAAACGVDGVCVVGAAAEADAPTLGAWVELLKRAASDEPRAVPAFPSPSLPIKGR